MQIWSRSNLAGSSWISFIITAGESTWCCSDHKNALGKCPWCWYLLKGEPAHPCSHSLSSMVPGDICWVIAALAVGRPCWYLSCMVSACHGLSFRLTVVVLCWTDYVKSHQYGCTLHRCYGMRELWINLSLSFLPLPTPSANGNIWSTSGNSVEKGKAIFLLVIKTGARICD